MKYLALDLGNRRKKKIFDKRFNSSSVITLFISKLQEGESETSGAETVQRREAPDLCRYLTGKSHGFCFPLFNIQYSITKNPQNLRFSSKSKYPEIALLK